MVGGWQVKIIPTKREGRKCLSHAFGIVLTWFDEVLAMLKGEEGCEKLYPVFLLGVGEGGGWGYNDFTIL